MPGKNDNEKRLLEFLNVQTGKKLYKGLNGQLQDIQTKLGKLSPDPTDLELLELYELIQKAADTAKKGKENEVAETLEGFGEEYADMLETRIGEKAERRYREMAEKDPVYQRMKRYDGKNIEEYINDPEYRKDSAYMDIYGNRAMDLGSRRQAEKEEGFVYTETLREFYNRVNAEANYRLIDPKLDEKEIRDKIRERDEIRNEHKPDQGSPVEEDIAGYEKGIPDLKIIMNGVDPRLLKGTRMNNSFHALKKLLDGRNAEAELATKKGRKTFGDFLWAVYTYMKEYEGNIITAWEDEDRLALASRIVDTVKKIDPKLYREIQERYEKSPKIMRDSFSEMEDEMIEEEEPVIHTEDKKSEGADAEKGNDRNDEPTEPYVNSLPEEERTKLLDPIRETVENGVSQIAEVFRNELEVNAQTEKLLQTSGEAEEMKKLLAGPDNATTAWMDRFSKRLFAEKKLAKALGLRSPLDLVLIDGATPSMLWRDKYKEVGDPKLRNRLYLGEMVKAILTGSCQVKGRKFHIAKTDKLVEMKPKVILENAETCREMYTATQACKEGVRMLLLNRIASYEKKLIGLQKKLKTKLATEDGEEGSDLYKNFTIQFLKTKRFLQECTLDTNWTIKDLRSSLNSLYVAARDYYDVRKRETFHNRERVKQIEKLGIDVDAAARSFLHISEKAEAAGLSADSPVGKWDEKLEQYGKVYTKDNEYADFRKGKAEEKRSRDMFEDMIQTDRLMLAFVKSVSPSFPYFTESYPGFRLEVPANATIRAKAMACAIREPLGMIMEKRTLNQAERMYLYDNHLVKEAFLPKVDQIEKDPFYQHLFKHHPDNFMQVLDRLVEDGVALRKEAGEFFYKNDPGKYIMGDSLIPNPAELKTRFSEVILQSYLFSQATEGELRRFVYDPGMQAYVKEKLQSAYGEITKDISAFHESVEQEKYYNELLTNRGKEKQLKTVIEKAIRDYPAKKGVQLNPVYQNVVPTLIRKEAAAEARMDEPLMKPQERPDIRARDWKLVGRITSITDRIKKEFAAYPEKDEMIRSLGCVSDLGKQMIIPDDKNIFHPIDEKELTAYQNAGKHAIEVLNRVSSSQDPAVTEEMKRLAGRFIQFINNDEKIIMKNYAEIVKTGSAAKDGREVLSGEIKAAELEWKVRNRLNAVKAEQKEIVITGSKQGGDKPAAAKQTGTKPKGPGF